MSVFFISIAILGYQRITHKNMRDVKAVMYAECVCVLRVATVGF